MIEKLKKRKEILYFIPFALFCFIALSGGSTILQLNDSIKIILYLIIMLLFGLKILIDKLSKKEAIIYFFIGIISLYTYIKVGAIFFLINFLAIIALKNVNIKTVVKIDILIKSIFLITHFIAYGIDYFFDYSSVEQLIVDDGNRIRHALYFTHPNIASALMFWLVMDFFYLKKELKFQHIVIGTIAMVVMYLITKSKTTPILYIMFLIIYYLYYLFKNKKIYLTIINIMQRYIVEVITILSIAMAILYQYNIHLITASLNAITSGRVYYSYIAIRDFGINLFCNPEAVNLENYLWIDNFYIRAAVLYGLVFVILLIIMEKLVKREKNENIFDKILFIILAISLFSEYFGIIAGNSISLLLLGNLIINRRTKKQNFTNKINDIKIEKEELISIIVPIYKVEKYLKKCIDSILQQSYHNLEIILVDDGSPDNCGRICDEYRKRDNRIVVIHKKNGGVADARNTGISAAKGEYIGFVDPDDCLHKDMYKILFNNIVKYNADISICGFSSVDEEKKAIGKPKEFNSEIKIFSKEESLENLLLEKDYTNHLWNKLYRKQLFMNKSITFPKGKIWEDVAVSYLLFEESKRVVYQNTELYYYIQRNKSIVSDMTLAKIKTLGNIITERNDYLQNKYQNLKDAIKIDEGKYIKYYYDVIYMQGYKELYEDPIYINYYNYYKSIYPKYKKEIKATQLTETGKLRM